MNNLYNEIVQALKMRDCSTAIILLEEQGHLLTPDDRAKLDRRCFNLASS